MRADGERETQNAKNEAQMKVNGEREMENGNVLLGHRSGEQGREVPRAAKIFGSPRPLPVTCDHLSVTLQCKPRSVRIGSLQMRFTVSLALFKI